MLLVENVDADPATNLAFDEALLLDAEANEGEDVLRLWEQPTPAVVLGSASRISEDVHIENCRNDGVPIYRRSSGGGTVLLGPGCLLYTLVLNYDREPALGEIRSSYAWILVQMANAIGLAKVEPAGISDLTLSGRKFSGTAQQRKRRYLLHHGTLLYRFDLDLLARYLQLPPRRPEYRRDRDHRSFVTNLPLSGEQLRHRIKKSWQAERPLERLPTTMMKPLLQAKYLQESWTFRL